MELIFVVLYGPAMALQLFIPCYFGSSVIWQSSLLSIEMFQSNWAFTSQNYKKLFLMSMVKMSPSFTLYAGRLVPLNLNTFIQVSLVFN